MNPEGCAVAFQVYQRKNYLLEDIKVQAKARDNESISHCVREHQGAWCYCGLVFTKERGKHKAGMVSRTQITKHLNSTVYDMRTSKQCRKAEK